jgi:hypothetical protein
LRGTVRAESPEVSLADGRDGTIFFASSTPTDLDQYLNLGTIRRIHLSIRCASC